MRKPLAHWRRERSLSQAQLAKLVGVTTSAVGNWEAGVRVPRLPTLRRVADVLGCSIEDIEFAAESTSKSANSA